jgi:hypothetical protein
MATAESTIGRATSSLSLTLSNCPAAKGANIFFFAVFAVFVVQNAENQSTPFSNGT